MKAVVQVGVRALGVLFWVTLCVAPEPLFGQAETVKHANAFLRLGADAAIEARSRTGFLTDFTGGAARENPAGLLQHLAGYHISASYSHQMGGMGHLADFSFTYRLDSVRALGAELLRYSVGGIPNTLSAMEEGGLNWDRISYFHVADWAARITYAHQLPVRGLQIGVNAKLKYRYAGRFAQGFGLGLDVGLRYEQGNLGVGVTLFDALTSGTLWFRNEAALQLNVVDTATLSGGRIYEVGLPHPMVAIEYRIAMPAKISFTPALRLDFYFDGQSHSPLSTGRLSVDPALGFQIEWNRMVFLRFGGHGWQVIQYEEDSKSHILTPTCGIGARAWGLNIDYSFSLPLTGATWIFTHLITAGYAF